MCKSVGKYFGNYQSNQSTKDFLKELSSSIGIPIDDLVQAKEGGNTGGTWVHPQVAVHLAQWASPKFAVQVTTWVVDFARFDSCG